MTSFRYGTRRKAQKLSESHVQPVKTTDEALSGLVRGEQASDLEERFANALDKYDIGYEFQVDVRVANGLPGQDKQVDFLLYPTLRPVDIYGYIGHYFTNGEKSYDRIREIELNNAFSRMGWNNLTVVSFEKLQTQYDADQFVRENFVTV